MKILPTKYVLSIKPKEYLHQGPSHCGAYSVKGILSAYGMDTKNHPKEYHPHVLGRWTGLNFGSHYYEHILKKNGIRVSRKTAKKLNPTEQLNLLKKLLISNAPVMIRIGNGYLTDKYNPIIGKLMGHWITLWGYDDKKQLFYVYDSALPREFREVNKPIGNTTRTYKEILRDWNFGKYQIIHWPFSGIDSHVYIEIYGRN